MIKSNKNWSINLLKGCKIRWKQIYHHSTKLSTIILHKRIRNHQILIQNSTCWNYRKIKNYSRCKTSWIIKLHSPHWIQRWKHTSIKLSHKWTHRSQMIRWSEWLPLRSLIPNLISYKKIWIFKINTQNKKLLNCNKKSKLPYLPKYSKWKNIKFMKTSQNLKISLINLQGKIMSL